jgi:hypothetical protein
MSAAAHTVLAWHWRPGLTSVWHAINNLSILDSAGFLSSWYCSRLSTCCILRQGRALLTIVATVNNQEAVLWLISARPLRCIRLTWTPATRKHESTAVWQRGGGGGDESREDGLAQFTIEKCQISGIIRYQKQQSTDWCLVRKTETITKSSFGFADTEGEAGGLCRALRPLTHPGDAACRL